MELTIGQVASMTRLTIRALRHYDDIGLLRPARVDPSSGYRYYTPDQITVAGTIAVLRSFDIDTATVAALIAGDVDVTTVIERERRRLTQLERRRRDALDVLRSLAGERPRPTPSVVDVAGFAILGSHVRVPASDDIAAVGEVFDELFTALDRAAISHDGDGVCVIHRNAKDELFLDVGVRSTGTPAGLGPYRSLEIEGGPTATVVHEGPLSSLPLGHAHLAAWVHTEGLEPVGPARETYLGSLADQRTEIALPVSGAG